MLEIIIYLHKGDERLFTSPNTLTKRYFDTEVYFPLIDNKDLKYFQSILIETGSVVFNHMNQNKHTGDISFSKAFIKNVIHITEWGLNPNKPLQLNFSTKTTIIEIIFLPGSTHSIIRIGQKNTPCLFVYNLPY